MTIAASVLRSIETALNCGAPPAMVATVALMAEAPASLPEAVAFIEEIAPDLLRLAERGPSFPRTLAELEPELRLDPEIARLRPDIGDHEVRGKLVFAELVGKRSFFQVAALIIAGVELSARDAELLEHLGVNTQLADARIWPLTVVRRIAARRGMAHGILAGAAMALNPNMGAQPVGAFMRTLERLEDGVGRGESVAVQLERGVARGERVSGVGRPVLGPDERNAHVFDLVRRYERDGGKSFRLALEVDAFFQKRKNQHINSAGLQGAILRDMGFSPAAGSAFCLLYFFVQILAQAVAAEERLQHVRESAGHTPAA
jgi:hypothetical protein